MSLSYHSEHLAWKQRVNQELSRATQFYSTNENFKRRSMYDTSAKSRMSHRTRSVGQDGNTGPSNLFLNSARMSNTRFSKQDDEELKNAKVNMGYSFGGTHHIKNAFKDGENVDTLEDTQNTNGIIRPRTNSLIARSAIKTRRVVKKDEDVRISSSRPLSKEQPSKFKPKQKNTVRSVKSVKEAEDDYGVCDEKKYEQDYDERIDERGSEDTQEGDQSPDKNVEDDKISTNSKVTTLSQNKYIEELEAKLREEKLKRMKAELELRKLSKNY